MNKKSTVWSFDGNLIIFIIAAFFFTNCFIIYFAFDSFAYQENSFMEQENNPCLNDNPSAEYKLDYDEHKKIYKAKKVKPQKKKQKIVTPKKSKPVHKKTTKVVKKKDVEQNVDSYVKPGFKDQFNDNVMALDCLPTPALWEERLMPEIYMGNNLWRSVGSAEFADGDYIEVMGRVLDSNCVPVSNALVEIWQLDDNGYDVNYYGQEDKTDEDINEERKNLLTNMVNKNFIGSGSINTDNLGYYRFYTIMPGRANEGRMPHINFNVRHKNFGEFRTQMYFPIDQYDVNKDILITKDVTDSMLRKLLVATKTSSSKNVGAGIPVQVYRFDIVLIGSDPYKGY